MSRESVELVRRFVVVDLDEAMGYLDVEIVWNPVEERPKFGRDAVRASLERWEGEWDDYQAIPEELVDLGDGRVLATVRFVGRGRGSGIPIDGCLHGIYTIRDGMIVQMDEFTERSDAVEAVSRARAEGATDVGSELP
jgi:ketosteroid isomerase-like protein